MKEIPYKSGSYYIFDRAYNNFKMLYKIHRIDAFFVVRAKKNLQYKSIKWKRKLPKGVLSDVTIELTGFYQSNIIPSHFD
jgi:transposase